MSPSESYRGVFTIPSTPFTETLDLDLPSLRRIVDFCIGCGAHGLVYPVNASSFSVLSDVERIQASKAVVEQCAGRIPVVIGVAGVSKEHAASFAAEARAMGADAVIAMTPYVSKIKDEGLVVDYYQAIADAVQRPVFIQNHTVGSELSIGTLARVVREVDHVHYIKEETFPVTHKLSGVLSEAGPKLRGVFGGAGGRFLLLEHPRGVAGQMPGCHVTDVVVRLWNALESGNMAEALHVYGALAPLYALENQWVGNCYKEILRIRGVIECTRTRNVTDSVDDEDRRALKATVAALEPFFTWHR